MIRIVNLKNYKPMPNEVLIKVDRSSPVGNPFRMKNEFMRNEVCNKYEKHFEKSMKNDIRFIRFIRDIVQLAKTHDIALGCWCYPKRCHAETILKFIENTLNINS